MSKVHVSLSYHRTDLDELDAFAEGVSQGIFGNPSIFTAPPIPESVIQAAIDAYVDKRAAYKNGGSAQKGAFQTAKTTLMGQLDTLADFVDGVANGDGNIITTAGFVPTKAVDSAAHKPAAPVVKVKRGESTGVLLAECAPVAGAEYYGCVVSEGQPLAEAAINGSGYLIFTGVNHVFGFILTKERKKEILGNVPGRTYYIYYYAVNAAGVSQLSEPVSIMAA